MEPIDLKSKLVALPRRLSVRKQSSTEESSPAAAAAAAAAAQTPAAPKSPARQHPPTSPASIEVAHSPSPPKHKKEAAAAAAVAAAIEHERHSPPQRVPSVRFASTASTTPQQQQPQPQQQQQPVASPSPAKSALKIKQPPPQAEENSPTPPSVDDAVVAVPPALLQAETAESFDFTLGNMIFFEHLGQSMSASPTWAWGVGREIVAARRRGGSEEPVPPAKRSIRVQLYEVETREGKLSVAEKGQLAAARKQISQNNAALHTLEYQHKALEGALAGARLTISSLEGSLRTDFADVYELLSSARYAVLQLSTTALAEVRSWTRPPHIARQVLELVVSALGPSSKTVSWSEVRERVRSESFTRDIGNFEPAQLSPEAADLIDQRVSSESLTLERANKASLACGPLYQWLLAMHEASREAKRSSAFYQISKEIAHHKQRQNQQEGELAALQPKVVLSRNLVSEAEQEVYSILYGGAVKFASGGGGLSDKCALVSSPFEGCAFIPSGGVVQMLRSACHDLGPVVEAEQQQQQQHGEVHRYQLSADEANRVLTAFDLPRVRPPKVKPAAGATTTTTNNGRGGKRAGVGPTTSGRKPARTSSQQPPVSPRKTNAARVPSLPPVSPPQQRAAAAASGDPLPVSTPRDRQAALLRANQQSFNSFNSSPGSPGLKTGAGGGGGGGAAPPVMGHLLGGGSPSSTPRSNPKAQLKPL